MARILIGNIKGPQGNDGAPGTVGPEGPPGPQGPPGEVDANTKITFEEAPQRTNVESGDTIRTIFGKMKKWFTDLKPHAFADPINNLTGTDASLPLAAPQGKALDDKITQLNSAFADRRAYLIDSGYTAYFTLNVPIGTMCIIFVSGSIFQIISLSGSILIIECFRCTSINGGDHPIVIPYDDQRYIAVRYANNTDENIRAIVMSAYDTVTKRN